MKTNAILITFTACAFAAPLFAQPVIGGSTCSSASLNGTFSLTLSGRDVSSSVAFAKAFQAIGTATFDGQSKVTFALTTNTNQAAGTPQTMAGTYSMQANCIGALNITAGDTATFTVESYNQGKAFLVSGQDGTYSFTGNGNLLPTAACSASQLNGNYSFNGNGFALASGSITGVNNISGTLQADGKSAVSGNFYVASGASNTTDSVTGQFTVSPSCTGSAKVSDITGTTYTIQFTITATNGSNFILSGATPILMFIGNGRTL